jgi:CRISPR-associated endoribonuclease Cas6
MPQFEVEFRVLPVRVQFETHDKLYFPPREVTNIFRGALGLALRQVCCDEACPGARACGRAAECAYAALFEPRWDEGPSGYRNAPRPFVLRCAEPLDLRVNLFDVDTPPLEKFEQAFRVIAEAGIGPGRAKSVLRSFEPQPVLRLPLRGTPAIGWVTLRFVTPTELKSGGEVYPKPEFGLLIERLAERVWTLGRFYQQWRDWDCRELLQEARLVQLVHWQWQYEHRQRRSSRTGQTHSLGGFVGTATYEGPVGVFLPLLEIGRWTGIGRQTVWGKGEIQVGEAKLP